MVAEATMPLEIGLVMSMKLSRRTLLRSSAVALALPLLEEMQARAFVAGATAAVPRRMVCMMTTLGINPENFFPENPGRDYALSPYLSVLKDLRNDFTVFSG